MLSWVGRFLLILSLLLSAAEPSIVPIGEVMPSTSQQLPGAFNNTPSFCIDPQPVSVIQANGWLNVTLKVGKDAVLKISQCTDFQDFLKDSSPLIIRDFDFVQPLPSPFLFQQFPKYPIGDEIFIALPFPTDSLENAERRQLGLRKLKYFITLLTHQNVLSKDLLRIFCGQYSSIPSTGSEIVLDPMKEIKELFAIEESEPPVKRFKS